MVKLYVFRDWKNNKNDVVLVNRQSYEPLFEASIELIKPTWNVVDVGASVGYYTILMAKKAKHVYAIECHPDSASILRRNIEHYKLENVTVIEKAVSGRSETFSIWEAGTSGGTSLRQRSYIKIMLYYLRRAGIFLGGYKNKSYVRNVRTETLDDLFKDLPIDLIKMDIQGMEFQALLSGAKNILNQGPVLLIEVHRRKYFNQKDFINTLREMGYSLELERLPNETAIWVVGKKK